MEDKVKPDGYSNKNKYPPFVIYDMPPEIATELMTYANTYSNRKCWMAIKQLLENKRYIDEICDLKNLITQKFK